MKKLVFSFCFLVAVVATATPTVTFRLSSDTGRIRQTGRLVAGTSTEVVFELQSGAWYDGGTYRLTVKPDGDYDTVIALASGTDFTVDGDELSCTLDLNTDEAYEYLAESPRSTIMLQLSDSTSAYGLEHRLTLWNSVQRDEDSTPSSSGIAYYTAAEVDSLVNAIDAGVSPIGSPIDGWTVECTDSGQLRIGDVASTQVLHSITTYTELSSLATTDKLIVLDATDGVHKQVTLQTLLTWIAANLP